MVLLLMIVTVALSFIMRCIYGMFFGKKEEIPITGYKEEWYGKGPKPQGVASETENEAAIVPFKIQVPEEVLSDLKRRLENTRFEDSLEEKSFEYGFHSKYLSEVVKYWMNEYNWRKQEQYLNELNHFKTKIEGINVHFVHVKPTYTEGKKVIPLLLVHGWPGSFLEFYKMIPTLRSAQQNYDFVFEIVIPSIPGYGFSDSPHHQGFNQRAAARIFVTLMERLGYSKFYIQGGDWGSLIVQLMARFYPTKILGVHVNMFVIAPKFCEYFKYLLVHLFPSLLSPLEYQMIFPLKLKLKHFMQETGYFHLQASKPDTVGTGLADSPVGLAAYILEKFSTWTCLDNRELPDGGLTEKFTLDELLTNVMIYWVNNNIKASVRFYREYMCDPMMTTYDDLQIAVPYGVALFPEELLGTPKWLVPKKAIKNFVHYTVMPRGGHFAAFEEPALLAEEIWKFVRVVEEKLNG